MGLFRGVPGGLDFMAIVYIFYWVGRSDGGIDSVDGGLPQGK